MGKWQDFRNAVRNPPPDRIASIEYKSHFLNILGVLFICIILISKGYWWVIFGFIFTLGVSYSQGMTAYNKFKLIQRAFPEKYKNIEDDPSPSRRRDRIVEENFGSTPKYAAILKAVIASWIILDPGVNGWGMKLAFVPLVIFLYSVAYYFPVYWIALITQKLKRRLNGKERKTS